MIAFRGQQVRQAVDLAALDNDTTAQERRDRVIRHARDGFCERRYACLGRQAVARSLHVGYPRRAIHIDQGKNVTRINKVRILNLGIDIPDFGPIPGVSEKGSRDIP